MRPLQPAAAYGSTSERQERRTGLVFHLRCIVVVTICTHGAGPRPLLGAPGRSLCQPSATQDATSAPIASCCGTATPSLPMLSARSPAAPVRDVPLPPAIGARRSVLGARLRSKPPDGSRRHAVT